jgi:hypothetical protein
MKRFLGYSLVGLLAYGAFLILQCPATTLMELAAQQLPGFTVQSAQGSALRGTAKGIRLHHVKLEMLTWQLRLLPLLLGRLEYKFAVAEPQLRLDGIVNIGLTRQLHIAELSGHMPLPQAIFLTGHPPPPVAGELRLEEIQLRLDQDGRPNTAHGMIRLLNAHTTFGRSLKLGGFSATLDSRHQDIMATIKDNGGPLELTGTFSLASNGRYHLMAQAAIRDKNNQQLQQALNMLTRPSGDGKWHIELTGMLPV